MQPSIVAQSGRDAARGRAAAFLRSTGRFFAHYFRRRALRFGTLLALVAGAAACAIAGQYGMKLLVDAMAGAGGASTSSWAR
jgi:hypothetical protein